MPYLIDGHNLIPKLGLQLASLDDETELVNKLNEFCRVARKTQVEVYFDNAQLGQPKTRRMGLVTAHFVRKPLIADQAIAQRLAKLGKAAKNWTVVSSDHNVQANARAVGAKAVTSDAFAETVSDALRQAPPTAATKEDMSQPELDEWMRLFREGKNNLSKL